MSDELTRQQKLEQEVLRCRSYGMGRNATANWLQVSTRQIDNISKALNIDWGGDHVAKANSARAEQLKSAKLDLADKFRKIASLELDSVLKTDCTTPGERRDQIMIAAISTDKFLKLTESTGAPEEVAGQAEAAAALDRFMYATKAAVHLDKGRPDDH
ncbi:hypothetical protein [Corynebacterium callunae]|uniref:Uncharacterized protein n=1 Tax=Corynebacterium callunae DSM 20147 TaxID=1121353 RepID=M1UVS0_9CORY|nr:hypothetical protein [Corynebacterium callunae]AGG67632.1 hypothetical protein H924_11020 [Corynebacterium callunae DSM 20147]